MSASFTVTHACPDGRVTECYWDNEADPEQTWLMCPRCRYAVQLWTRNPDGKVAGPVARKPIEYVGVNGVTAETEQDVTGDPEADADQFVANMGHIQEGSRCGCVVAGGPFGGTGAHKPRCPVGAEWELQRQEAARSS